MAEEEKKTVEYMTKANSLFLFFCSLFFSLDSEYFQLMYSDQSPGVSILSQFQLTDQMSNQKINQTRTKEGKTEDKQCDVPGYSITLIISF